METASRLLDPVELITLTRMTFPHCEPVVDDEGRFIIRGMARREGVRNEEVGEMFPFAALTGKSTTVESRSKADKNQLPNHQILVTHLRRCSSASSIRCRRRMRVGKGRGRRLKQEEKGKSCLVKTSRCWKG